MDIMWWLSTMGTLDEQLRAQISATRPTAEPSVQLAGRPDRRDVDLPSLQARGVTLAGRLRDISGRRVRFAEDLPGSIADADLRMGRLLHRVDAYAHAVGLDDEIEPPPPAPRTARAAEAPRELDLAAAGIGSVVWATGYRRDYPWLRVPVLDDDGEIRHSAGTTAAPGLHVMGMRRQTRRTSTFIDGVRHDAALVTDRILADLGAARPDRQLKSAA
jgi:putative flavoprotein involved in K+ transport